MPGGVQGLDRYAYVNNNPVNFNDPTGHDVGCAGIDMYMCGIYGKSYAGWANSVKDEAFELWKEDPGVFNNKSADKIFELLPEMTPSMKAYQQQHITRIKQGEVSSDNSYQVSELRNLVSNTKEMLALMRAIDGAINIARPAYKQFRYSYPTGPLEAVAAGGLQLWDDRDSYLSTDQKWMRAGALTGEALIIDGVTTWAGVQAGGLAAVGGPITAGIAYFAVSYGGSWGLDSASRGLLNPWLFPKMQLGEYP